MQSLDRKEKVSLILSLVFISMMATFQIISIFYLIPKSYETFIKKMDCAWLQRELNIPEDQRHFMTKLYGVYNIVQDNFDRKCKS